MLACALWLGLATAAFGHDVADELRVHGFVRPQGEHLVVVMRLPLQLLLNVDLPKHGNGYLDLDAARDAFPRAIAATAKGIVFLEDGEPLVPRGGEARIALPSDRSFDSYEGALAAMRGPGLPAGTDVFWNQGFLDVKIEYPLASPPGALSVDFRVSPGLRDRLRLDLRYLMPDGAVRAFEIPTDAGPVPLDPRWHQAAASFVRSGFEHILGGADHLLFLVCLVVPFRRIGWPLVGVVTAFTLGHSIALISAAYGAVPRSLWFPPLVETLIALSILYMAVENLLRPRLARRWIVAGAFGVIHGFGFSFALANELQFAGSHLVLSLLAFNVGIELGQLLVLALMWPLMALVYGRLAIEGRIVDAIVSAFVGHSAWHWLSERWPALVDAGLPDWRSGVLQLPALLAVAGIVVGVWLLRRRPAGSRSAPHAPVKAAGTMKD
ncbi:HupE/UreJ family protein [Piscinibacter sp.]|uniref:HupE/UreJ family protein n=1 Tax=Piscinibacter sp. TaxID=1903157 RepID=UPI002CDC3706|nr:HupE/UreJ family protein [Albitalea sp.]HUG23168.1 HupE/UreJ family protein [Albitalea sp.]